ncbi:diacylglycerol kinase N-terminus [White spot syndrome virus]|uniref:Diacylglycerol kinase N-terminus n=1 Tax=White spot syndrome virus TaxID=342409 RepID=A0A0X9MI01_9VIRU|nr:diacylglycerol kinase N-terminus [White spot syndrome virus]
MTHLVLLILSLSLSPVYHHLTPYLSPHLTYTPISPITSIFPHLLFTRSSFNTLFLPSQPITRSGPQSSLLSLTGTIYAPQALAVYIRRRGQARSISSLQASRRATQQALSLSFYLEETCQYSSYKNGLSSPRRTKSLHHVGL